MSAVPPIPAELWTLMDQLGPKWGSNVPGHVRLMVEAFTPLLARCPKDGIRLTRGIAYGAHPRQILDVYQAAGSRGAPMVLFVHGGAFVDGDKDRSPEIYGNVLYYLARHGIIGINVEYRLAPESVPISVRSLKSPRWPTRNTLPASLPKPVPSDISQASSIVFLSASAS